ncbi:ABC transporter ATP-binding protein [Okeania sp. KiyG1]|uniref:ABC transporter ATP-binding protein n=1 Tax=Okeania sp. KiyG1 TaxID=2720165 RepID=UPI0019A23945|nr:ABC transporter ATP-binding protein [Okeania sp. KiyG1]GGA39585.1 protein-tyrosine-phosphatase [Okeania sp. KiyG1]
MSGSWKIIRKFWPQIRKQKSTIATSLFALIAETCFRLLEPWPLKFIFDKIILTDFNVEPVGIKIIDDFGAMGLLTVLALAIVAIASLRALAAYYSAINSALAATNIMTEVRNQLYHHLQSLSLSFHSKAKSGDLIARVTYDIERLREVTVIAIVPLLTNLLTLVGMLGVMFWISWQKSFIATLALPIFMISTLYLGKRIENSARVQRKREGAMAATAAEAIGAIKVVQALSLQEMLGSNFSSHNKKSLNEGVQTQKLKAAQERIVEILLALTTALVLWRGVQLIQKGEMTPGDLLVFITYLKMAFKPMRQLAKYTGQIAKATASGERIVDLLEIEPKIQDARGAISAPPFQGAVRFDNVSFAYEDENLILKNVNFEVKPGQKVALVGTSGGGKSTLVSLLLRLYDPLEGRILIDDRDLREYKVDSLRQQISIVLQDSVLFAVSVGDNIAYGCLEATEADIITAAKLANAHDFIMELPNGYDTVVGERGATLSGGQRQRIAIARAIVRQAPIVILDEPTVGLDNENEREVSEALARLTENCTTFLITHDLRAAKPAGLILYIESGTIVEKGTHQQLIELGEKYAGLYKLQTSINVIPNLV